MAKKTYVPKLLALLRVVCLYIVRYRLVLIASLTALEVTNAEAKLDAVIAACEAITGEAVVPEGD